MAKKRPVHKKPVDIFGYGSTPYGRAAYSQILDLSRVTKGEGWGGYEGIDYSLIYDGGDGESADADAAWGVLDYLGLSERSYKDKTYRDEPNTVRWDRHAKLFFNHLPPYFGEDVVLLVSGGTRSFGEDELQDFLKESDSFFLFDASSFRGAFYDLLRRVIEDLRESPDRNSDDEIYVYKIWIKRADDSVLPLVDRYIPGVNVPSTSTSSKRAQTRTWRTTRSVSSVKKVSGRGRGHSTRKRLRSSRKRGRK